MGSIKRVKSLSKKYVDETFKKPVLISEQKKTKKIVRTGETTEDLTNDGETTPRVKSRFYVEPFHTNLGPD